MPGLLDNQSIPIGCAHCGHKTEKTIGWLKTNNHFVCRCGTRVNVDASQFLREMGGVDKAFADLQRTLRNFGR